MTKVTQEGISQIPYRSRPTVYVCKSFKITKTKFRKRRGWLVASTYRLWSITSDKFVSFIYLLLSCSSFERLIIIDDMPLFNLQLAAHMGCWRANVFKFLQGQNYIQLFTSSPFPSVICRLHDDAPFNPKPTGPLGRQMLAPSGGFTHY